MGVARLGPSGGEAFWAVPVGAVAVPSTRMSLTVLLLAEPTSATPTSVPPPDSASWWDYGVGLIDVLGSLAAITAVLIALVWLKPKIREWREAFVGRVFAWRWASPRGHRLRCGEASLLDRAVERLLFIVGHRMVPRAWRMTEEGKKAWDDSFEAAVEEYARRDELRHRHRESTHKRRVLSRKRCADCGERCDAMGTLYEDGSAVCGECGLQRRAAETGTRWERYESDRGFGFRRVPLEPTPSDTKPATDSEEPDSIA